MNHDEHDLIATLHALIDENAHEIVRHSPGITTQLHITWGDVVRLSVQHQLPARKLIARHEPQPPSPLQRTGTE